MFFKYFFLLITFHPIIFFFILFFLIEKFLWSFKIKIIFRTFLYNAIIFDNIDVVKYATSFQGFDMKSTDIKKKKNLNNIFFD